MPDVLLELDADTRERGDAGGDLEDDVPIPRTDVKEGGPGIQETVFADVLVCEDVDDAVDGRLDHVAREGALRGGRFGS